MTAVDVVIATKGRPALLRRALASVFAQQTDARLDVVVVRDGGPADDLADVAVPAPHTLRTVDNARTPGLAGARNTGVLAGSGDVVAFCDDDDEWLPAKLELQLALLESPSTSLVATGIRIVTSDETVERTAPAVTTFRDLLDSRITELHPSAFVLRRETLVDEVGLVDEALPAGYGEDYDLLLRAARAGVVRAVPDALTVVHWDRQSYFTERWRGVVDGLGYLLAKFPEFETRPRGAARIEAQIAFASAAQGDARDALRWARRALRHDARQVRAYLAALVAVRALSPAAVVRFANARGRGV